MYRKAVVSSCSRYRYALWRIWDDKQPAVFFIGLNPSTADAISDDSTIRRCTAFAREWGYGGFVMGNLFAFRTKYPKKLREATDPIGPDNDKWLVRLSRSTKIIIAVWGNNGTYLNRDRFVMRMFANMYCLKLSKQGTPCHPLYLSGQIKPQKIKDQIICHRNDTT